MSDAPDGEDGDTGRTAAERLTFAVSCGVLLVVLAFRVRNEPGAVGRAT